MKKILQLLFMATLTANSINSNSQTSNLFPTLTKIDGNFVEEFKMTQRKQFEGFFQLNPEYFKTGNYKWADSKFSNSDYPSIISKTSNDLSDFSAIQVVFNDFIPFASGFNHAYYSFCHSVFEFDHMNYYELKNNSQSEYGELNNFYKKSLNDILKEKKAKNILLADMLVTKLSYDDSLSNNLILEFTLDNIYGFAPNVKNPPWPSCYQLSVKVLGTNGEVLNSYRQAIFFRLNRRQAPTHSIEILKSIIRPAFENLVNQLLNDIKTIAKIKQMNVNQKILMKQNYNELNKSQFSLLNFALGKKKIISQLVDLGYNVEELTFESFKSDPVYNSSISSSTNQLISSTADLLGNSLLAHWNAKKIKNTKLLGTELLARFEKLDKEESLFIKDINPNLLNSPAALFLPNNAELTKSMALAVSELTKKNQTASSNGAKQKNSIISNDLVSVTNQVAENLTPNDTNRPSETLAEGLKDGNSPEAKACAAEAQNEWKHSCAYSHANDPSLIRYQHRYAILAKKKIVEIMIAKCSEYISENEMTAYKGVISGLDSQFYSMGGWDGLDANCK